MDLSRRSFVRGMGAATAVGTVGAVTHGSAGTEGESAGANAMVAGSLLRLANRIPGATIEAHGSAAVQQMILNDVRDPDAVALADPRLFNGITERATFFATNALVLTYAPASEYATAIERDWRTAIERKGVHLGRTDPQTDPLGYRTVMALRLAQDEYGVNPQRVLDNATIFPETGLLNVVKGGKIDAAFTYRNMAVQRDLPYVSLPDRIDFSNPEYADAYETVSYDLNDRTIQGAPIRYAATALTETGTPWIEKLVTANDLLRETGFVVPSDYPREQRLPASSAQ